MQKEGDLNLHCKPVESINGWKIEERINEREECGFEIEKESNWEGVEEAAESIILGGKKFNGGSSELTENEYALDGDVLRKD